MKTVPVSPDQKTAWLWPARAFFALKWPYIGPVGVRTPSSLGVNPSNPDVYAVQNPRDVDTSTLRLYNPLMISPRTFTLQRILLTTLLIISLAIMLYGTFLLNRNMADSWHGSYARNFTFNLLALVGDVLLYTPWN